MVPTDNEQMTKTPSPGNARTGDRTKSDARSAETNKDGVQGEGNYKAAREFNEAERKFVAAGKVAAAARAAAPRSDAEQQAMLAAEQEGRRRGKEDDPMPAKVGADSVAPKASAKDVDRKRG